MTIKKVGVLGCGLMGSGIAQVAASAGCDVVVLEQEQKFLDKGFAGIEKSLSRLVERGPAKGGITAEQKAEAQSHLKGTTSMQDLADCDIVIEAIIENVEEKRKTYAQLDAIVKKDAIFATNTSSISVTELMTATKRPERFIGLHFFNPVPMMKLVEVVKTIATAPDVYDAAVEFGKKLGKVPVRTSDKTGFIVNRLLVPYLLDAIRAYEEGVGSITDIDEAMKLGCGYPDGAVHAAGFCRPRHHLLHHARHVRRVQGAPLRLAAAVEATGAGRLVRPQVGQRLLRLHRPEEPGAGKLRVSRVLRRDYAIPNRDNCADLDGILVVVSWATAGDEAGETPARWPQRNAAIIAFRGPWRDVATAGIAPSDRLSRVASSLIEQRLSRKWARVLDAGLIALLRPYQN